LVREAVMADAKIIKTKDPEAIRYMLKSVGDYIEHKQIEEYDIETSKMWIRRNITYPTVGVWLAMTEENVCVGHGIAYIQATLSHELVNIYQLFSETPEVEEEILEYINSWAQENGIKKIMHITKFPKKWKEREFEIDKHILIKEV